MIIESTRNETVKRAKSLANRKGRLESGLHFIEGERLVREAVVSGVEFHDAFIEEGHDLMVAVLQGSGAHVHVVSRSVIRSLTNTNEPQWVCATVKTPLYELPRYYPDGLIVVLDCVQDPGNIGSILRSADAFGVSGIVLGNGCADPFAPKPVRASMGSVYHVPLWFADVTEELTKLKNQGFSLVCGHLDGEEVFPEVSGKMALIIGNEGNGVDDGVADMCIKYRLPMYGFAESLNASVAAGILIYETATKMHNLI